MNKPHFIMVRFLFDARCEKFLFFPSSETLCDNFGFWTSEIKFTLFKVLHSLKILPPHKIQGVKQLPYRRDLYPLLNNTCSWIVPAPMKWTTSKIPPKQWSRLLPTLEFYLQFNTKYLRVLFTPVQYFQKVLTTFSPISCRYNKIKVPIKPIFLTIWILISGFRWMIRIYVTVTLTVLITHQSINQSDMYDHWLFDYEGTLVFMRSKSLTINFDHFKSEVFMDRNISFWQKITCFDSM